MKNNENQMVWSSLFRQYSVLLRAGVSAEEATALLCEDGQEPLELLQELLSRQENGAGFGEAVRESGAFPDYTGEVVRIGEDTGHLEQCCASLAEFYERRALLEDRLRNALRYPAVLLLMMCAVLAVLIFTVLPVFNRVYESLSGSLATSSYGYVVLGGVLGRVALALALVFCVLALLLARKVRREGVEALNELGKKFRFAKTPLRMLDASRLADLMSTMLSSGMNDDEALSHCSEALQGGMVDEELRKCTAEVEEGESLGSALRESGIFPPVTARVLLAEAESGRIDRGLKAAADSCGEDGMEQLCALIDGVEPCLSVFLTVTVGLSLLSAMLPLIGILGSIG